MRIVQGLESYPPDAERSVVALGAFDGIHLGHRAILGTAVARGHARGIRIVACTFDRHPMDVLSPSRAPAPLTTLDERLTMIAETGVDVALVLAFTPELARVEPEAFVLDVVVGRLHAQEVVVGYNHTFGRGARGDATLLCELGGPLGLATHVVPPLLVDGVIVSSSEIRAVLREGDVGRAARYLGRPYSIAGVVTRGAGRGRTLGFPTANLDPERPLLLPIGVYACRAEIDGEQHRAVVNVGVRPTFGDNALAIEAYLMDVRADLYDRPLRLHFVAHLRGEQKFGSVDELRAQIARDVEAARDALRAGV
jgi:riboflavin kinase / FMN adenylyltransferase